MSSSIKNVTVAGGGVLGSQIAMQSAKHGFNVTVYDISDEALKETKTHFDNIGKRYEEDLDLSSDKVSESKNSIELTTDLEKAVSKADLIIEAVPEKLDIKKEFYSKLSEVAPKETIFATNTSTLLPSDIAPSTDRPEKFLALHFANEIWKNNTAEIMGHEDTKEEVFDQVVEFAKDINMVALPLKKEQPGYIVNSLLVPFLGAAMKLWAKGIADYETIDKTWMVATGAPKGPFGMIDVVGLNTVYNIEMAQAEANNDDIKRKFAERIKEDFIDKNKTGVADGEGFYKYPNPAFTQEGFLDK